MHQFWSNSVKQFWRKPAETKSDDNYDDNNDGHANNMRPCGRIKTDTPLWTIVLLSQFVENVTALKPIHRPLLMLKISF